MIELNGVQKVQDKGMLIDIPSLVVKAGESVALLGPVDSGKDILFQLLTGELHPTMGSVLVAGVDPYHEREAFGRLVGVLFSENNLYERMSALDNLEFFCRLRRLPGGRAAEVLEQVGLADHINTGTDKLSPGLSRRLALGRAILDHPRVLLLADPFAGCEQASINVICQVVRGLVQSGTTVLAFTQDAANLEMLCDTIFRLDQGRIVESFDAREQLHQRRPFMIPARGEEKIILVDPADILYVFARQDRAFLQTREGRLPTRFTMAELEKRLSRSGFFRAHRGFLVNLQQVKEVIPYTRDSYNLKLKDEAGTEIPLSKSAERELRDLLGY
jgi:ABC-2 type transport system ATP-binding protein